MKIDWFYVIRWICALLQVIGMGVIGGNYGWYIGRMVQFRDYTWEITYAGIAVGLVVGTVLSRLYGVMSSDWDEDDDEWE